MQNEAEWHDASTDQGALLVARGATTFGELDWPLTGRHNRYNALAAIAAARHVGIRPGDALDALRRFKSVKRRMEVRGRVAGITVYDDFAHHPSAIQTTLAGLRHSIAKEERILAVLEPRSNTMKLGVMSARLPDSLADADLVFGFGPTTGSAALGWSLAEALAPIKGKSVTFESIELLLEALVKTARSGDHVVIMSNGGFGGIHQRLVDQLAARS